MKQTVNIFDYAPQICKAMSSGILLTTKHNGRVNTMTIGWGMLGIEWGKPIFIALVRESRYTKELLENSGEFTVNIPLGDHERKVLGYCGTKSGRDCDKIKDMELTLIESEQINTPGIKEFPLTLECRVLYKQAQDLSAIPEHLRSKYYPDIIQGSDPGKNRDYHIAYYGEIINAYLIQK